MTTGISPFRAPSPVATLTLVCTHDPEAVGPAQSGGALFAISNYISRLLDKDRNGRPAHAGVAAGEIAELEGQLTASLRPGRRPVGHPAARAVE